MKLKKITLENFRNYPKLDIEFDEKKTTFIVGSNAQGKTNILEAIYLLALTKSFRTSRQSDLINWDKDFARVKGVFDSDKQTELEVFLGNAPNPTKSLKKNGVKISTEDFIGNCKTVFFHPEDLNILYLGPDLRRRYLDILNVQVNKKYYRALRTYKRLLEQRNSLLKAINRGANSVEDLDVWDEQLVQNGSIIIHERAKTIAFANQYLQDIYRNISGHKEKIEIRYKCSVNKASDDLEEVITLYTQALYSARKKDLRFEYTTVGPHRDEIEFNINGRTLASSASRGEIRSLLLSLKFIEIQFYEEKTGEKPLLLLDDVFSELDFDRQKMLTEKIEGHQTIITATHIDDIVFDRGHGGLKKKSSSPDLLHLEKGTISRG